MLTMRLQRSTGFHLGGFLFAPVRHGIAPRLRLRVSGGARLERETEKQLEALGWIGRTEEERVVNALRQCVIALGGESDGTAGLAVVADHPADPASDTHQ
ncbi:MAG: hypothetical protein WA633_29160 [Stellaceae bacterium]